MALRIPSPWQRMVRAGVAYERNGTLFRWLGTALPHLRDFARGGRRAWRTQPRLSTSLAAAVVVAAGLLLVGWLLVQSSRVHITIRPAVAVPGPVWLTGPGITGAPVFGQTLTAGSGGWSGTVSSYSYQWQRCNPGCADVGSNQNTYMLGGSDVGATIRVIVTATGPSGSTSHTSASTAPVSSAFSTPSVSLTASKTLVTGLSQPSDGQGNGHDNQLTSPTRAPDGNLFAVWVSGTSTTDLTYTLVKSTDNGSTWTSVDSGNDAGGQEAYVAVAPNNEVYVLTWNNGTPGQDYPRVADYGVDALRGGSPMFTVVPGTWALENMEYGGFAVDSSGNLYLMQNITVGNTSFGSYQGHLAWTTGGSGNFTWHYIQLPSVEQANGGQDNFRYGYPFLLPDNNGGIDIVMSNDVSCANTSFTNNAALSNPAYATQSSGYMYDRVYDWHTSDLNASGGPSWTVNQMSKLTRADGGVDCVANTWHRNDFAQYAFRDVYGFVHVMSTECQSGGTCTPFTAEHEVLNGDGVVDATNTITAGCADHAMMVEDNTGRFYVVSYCTSRTVYIRPADTTNGTTIQSTTTLKMPHGTSGNTWIARPQGGTFWNQKYMDYAYPWGGTGQGEGTSIDWIRINLAR